MARHWVQELPADTRRSTWTTTPLPETADGPVADHPVADHPGAGETWTGETWAGETRAGATTAAVHPMVPAARTPADVEAPEAASA